MIGLVVHPSRDVTGPREALEAWAVAHGEELGWLGSQCDGHGALPAGTADECSLIVAIGGDGTILGGARLAANAERRPPVLGIAWGSLGMLAATQADDLVAALDRHAAGEWVERGLDGIRVTDEEGRTAVALNDVCVVRKGSGQVKSDVHVDGALYVRAAGDGIVVSTPLGSSAYGMAAGGPILAPGLGALCVTPLAMHGGSAPPLVVPASSALRIEVTAGFHGRRLEIDGQPAEVDGHELDLELEPGHVVLVSFGDDEGFLEGLRRRAIITDSPRIVAHEKRLATERGEAERSSSHGKAMP